jgi:hypothetical protein
MEGHFAEDPKIQRIAEAYALDAIDFAAEHFRRTLDWSDASVAHIEAIMDRFHRDLAQARPSDKRVIQFTRMFGSYVGEVFLPQSRCGLGHRYAKWPKLSGIARIEAGRPVLALGQSTEPLQERRRG